MDKKFINNNRGEKIVSVYWFAILFIVAAAVVYMVAIFYGKPYDIRELEADILTDKIADCISNAGYLEDFVLKKQEGFEKLTSENFLEKCGLNFNVEDVYGWKEQEQYYVELNVSGFGTNDTILEIKEGNPNLNENCEIESKNFPVCLERSFYSLDKEGNQYKINILSIVRKTEKNVQ